MEQINYYCDESCHLPLFDKNKDNQIAMVLGTVHCNIKYIEEVKNGIKKIKEKHNIPHYYEIKWTKVSKGEKNYYIDLVNYFFNNDQLGFRCIIARDKNRFDYNIYSHDELYYIMYYFLLDKLINKNHINNIYLDKKDTQGKPKVAKLKKYLKNRYSYYINAIGKVQITNSNDIILMQLTDLLIGAIGYYNRGLQTNETKLEIIDIIQSKINHQLSITTPSLREKKFNVFYWKDND